MSSIEVSPKASTRPPSPASSGEAAMKLQPTSRSPQDPGSPGPPVDAIRLRSLAKYARRAESAAPSTPFAGGSPTRRLAASSFPGGLPKGESTLSLPATPAALGPVGTPTSAPGASTTTSVDAPSDAQASRRKSTATAVGVKDVFPSYDDIVAVAKARTPAPPHIAPPDGLAASPSPDAPPLRGAAPLVGGASKADDMEVPLHALDDVMCQRHARTNAFLRSIATGAPVAPRRGSMGRADVLVVPSGDAVASAVTATPPAAPGAVLPASHGIVLATARAGLREQLLDRALDSATAGADDAVTVNGMRSIEHLHDLVPADLERRATSLSCRNFFRSLEMRPETSSDETGSAADDNRSSSAGSSTTKSNSTQSAGSSDMRRCADGVPRSAKQLAGLVRRGRTLPVRLTTTRGQTVGWVTLVANYGEQTHASSAVHGDDTANHVDIDDDDEGEAFNMARRADLLVYVNWMNVFKSPALLRDMISSKRRDKEVGYRALVERHRAVSPIERDAYFLDDPSMAGEQRVKRMNLSSYCTSVIVFTDKETARKEIDQRFWLKHPQCERNQLRLSALRRFKGLMLQVALDHGSPIDISTVVHAVVYFERLVVNGFVVGDNKRVVASVCMVLAAKFNESGIVKRSEMQRKIQYVASRMDDAFGIDTRTTFAWELKVLVALEFSLMVPEKAGLAHLVALLATRNIAPVTYFGYYKQRHRKGLHDDSSSDSDGDGSSSSSS